MALQFKIQLKNISKPAVWRRVVAPESFTFLQFHDVIQRAFGWDSYHLFEFSPQGFGSYPAYGIPSPQDDGEMTDARKIKISTVFKKAGQKFNYIYDFGDEWSHSILLELRTTEKIITADCIAGKGKCPPEDCGGTWGYENLLKILANPADEEHTAMMEWLGIDEPGDWDVNEFDLEDARASVKNAGNKDEIYEMLYP